MATFDPNTAVLDDVAGFDPTTAVPMQDDSTESLAAKPYLGGRYDVANVKNIDPQQARAQAGAVAQTAALFGTAGATSALPLVARSLAMGVAGAGGDAASKFIQGQEQNIPESVKAFALAGAPVPAPISANLLSLQNAVNVFKGAASMGSAVLAGNYVEQALANRDLLPFKSDDSGTAMDKAFKDTVLPTILGGVTFGAAGKLLNMATTQTSADATAKVLGKIGVDNPQLGDVLPKEYGILQQNVAQTTPELANRIAASRSPISKAFYSLIGNAPQNEQIATQLQPLVGQMDEAEKAFQMAQKSQIDSQQAAQRTLAKADLSIPERSKILAQVTSDELNAVTAQAQAQIHANIAADSISSQTGKAEALRGVVDNLYEARSNASKALLAEAEIPRNEPLFSRTEMVAAAKSAMGSGAESIAGKSILKSIQSFGAQQEGSIIDNVLGAAGKAPSVAPQVTMTAEQFRNLANKKPDTRLNFTQLQDLRSAISDGFVGTGLDTNAMTRAEDLAAKAYGAIGDSTKSTIKAELGEESLNAYQKYLDFWRETSQLRDSKFGGALLRGEITDESIKGLASKIASGQVDEIKNYKNFVNLIGEQNPAVADLARTTMASAIRNSFVEAASSNGVVDYQKLGKTLNAAISKSDLPVPIETFRFGNATDIKNWNKVLQEFKPSDLSPERMQMVMESPEVQKILKVGGKDMPDTLRVVLATDAFNKRVLDAASLMALSATKEGREAYQDAVSLAYKAGLTASATEEAVQKAANDPVLSAFRGKSYYVLTNEAGKLNGEGTVTNLIGGMKRAEASKAINGLRTSNPELAGMIERRLLANEFDQFSKTDGRIPGEAYSIDSNKVRQYFNPQAHDSDSRVQWLKDVLGTDKVKSFEKFANALASLDDQTRQAIIGGKTSHPALEAARLARTVTSGAMSGNVLSNVIRSGIGFYERGKFNTLSAMIMEDGFLNVVNRSSGDVAEALSSMPMQKAYLLLKDKRFTNELGKN